MADPDFPSGAVHRESQLGSSLRTSRLRLSVVWMGGSRVASLVVQVVAIPIILGTVGAEAFGAYAAIAASLSWLVTSQLGIGPALVLLLRERSGYEERTRLVATTFWLTTGLVVGVAAAAIIILISVAPSTLLGSAFVPYDEELRRTGIAIAILTSIQVVCSTAESVQAAELELHHTYAWQVVANIGVICALLIVANMKASILWLAIAMQLPITVTKAANALVVFHRHRMFVPRLSLFDSTKVMALLRKGAPFLLIQLGSFTAIQIALVVAARSLGPSSLAVTALAVRMLLLLGSGAGIITQSFWPTVLDARVRGDDRWLRRSFIEWLLIALTLAGVTLVALVVDGPAIFSLWSSGTVPVSTIVAASVGVAFFVDTWMLFFHHALVGLGGVRAAATVYLASAAVQLAFIVVTISTTGEAAIPLGIIVSDIVLGVWILPVMTIRKLRDLRLTPAGGVSLPQSRRLC